MSEQKAHRISEKTVSRVLRAIFYMRKTIQSPRYNSARQSKNGFVGRRLYALKSRLFCPYSVYHISQAMSICYHNICYFHNKTQESQTRVLWLFQIYINPCSPRNSQTSLPKTLSPDSSTAPRYAVCA